MNARVERLRERSQRARPALSAERALLLTRFYRERDGRLPVPVMRARAYLHLCETKTIWIGADELLVGERGPRPKAVPTFPELTCHGLEDLRILATREKTSYEVSPEVLEAYEREVIPYWRGRTLREQLFAALPPAWHAAYEAGVFTEFMEQRAPGHTVLDDKIYRRGLLDFVAEIDARLEAESAASDPDSAAAREQLEAMRIACQATILFAERHAELAAAMASAEPDPTRRAELLRIADVCRHVPARAPRDFHEALQSYWFCHLGVITELNGWDSFNPGRLDQHLLPFYERGLAEGTLDEDGARELLACFFVKFNNHPAPPKVGVTAAESGTWTDFANINLGGLTREGRDGSNAVTHLLLDVIDELHLLQPGNNLQLSRETPDEVLRHALRVVRQGYGFPSLFNADAVVQEQLRMGKTLEDARAGGCSGCVETGAFGKEAYVLTGYFNLPKLLELALNDGVDPRSGRRVGVASGRSFASFDAVMAAFRAQLDHLAGVKLDGNEEVARLYARAMPAPFLSVLTDDCIANARDYNAGGARYNNSYVQGVGIGTVTDSLAALRALVFESREVALDELAAALANDFAGREPLRARLVNKAPKYGNDDERADELMRCVFEAFFAAIDGRPCARGGCYRIQMLPTTCHVYFGALTGATPDGRRAGTPLSEGISPVQGRDRKGPTAVLRSAARMDHLRTGGTLLNLKLTPAVVAGEQGLAALAGLVRGYFAMNGHHVQFNVVSAATLREAQQHPDEHRGLIVRVAGYSDYFCDLSRSLQDEIIERTEHTAPD